MICGVGTGGLHFPTLALAQAFSERGPENRGLFGIARGMILCWLSILSFKPDLVLGVGGYASGPVVLTAWAMGVKTAVQEQNAFPGLSNRLLGEGGDRW